MFNNDETLLHAAVKKGNIDIVEILLLNPEIDINIRSIFKQIF